MRPDADGRLCYDDRMKRRVFIAVLLPPEVKHRTGEAVREFEWLPIRWLKPENWHITLLPPFYLDDAGIRLLAARLKNISIDRAILIHFSRIILAPEGVRSRMIWLEGPSAPELARLEERLYELMAVEPSFPRLKKETRPFHLHVTLARFEPGALAELEAKTRVLAEVDCMFRASEIALMESRLKSAGAEYHLLERISMV